MYALPSLTNSAYDLFRLQEVHRRVAETWCRRRVGEQTLHGDAHCLFGAIEAAVFPDRRSRCAGEPDYRARWAIRTRLALYVACAILERSDRLEVPRAAGPHWLEVTLRSVIISWNDFPGRRKSEVLAVLEAAIDRARADLSRVSSAV